MFDEQKHTYRVNGEIIPGTTSILGVINKPALIAWSAAEAAKYVQEHLLPGKALSAVEIETLCLEAKAAHRKKKDTAADIGHLTHAWIENYIKDNQEELPINKEAKNGCQAFLTWLIQNKVDFIKSEQRIYSKKYNYAGTLDALAVVNGELTLIDFKTGSGCYPEMGYQLASYQLAFEEEFTETHITKRLICNIKKTGELETKEYPEYEKDRDVFLASMVLWKRQQEHKEESKLSK